MELARQLFVDAFEVAGLRRRSAGQELELDHWERRASTLEIKTAVAPPGESFLLKNDL